MCYHYRKVGTKAKEGKSRQLTLTTRNKMLFCPTCSNILLTEQSSDDMRFFCRTCPYIYRIEKKFESKMHLQRKEVDDVLGGSEAFKDASATSI